MNRSILITGANAGIGKDTARQLALLSTTEKIYLGCRNEAKAKKAKKNLEEVTGKNIFEILLIDTSKPESVRKAVASLNTPIDALIMNAGGMGGKTPAAITKDGVMEMFASNVLGHVVLVDELIKVEKLNNVALLASSEAVRGVKMMGMTAPSLPTSSVDDFASVIDGTFFGKKMDPMEAYGYVKYTATQWMASLARKHKNIRFINMSPGATKGTDVMNDMKFPMNIIFKYIAMPVLMPMMGMAHSLEKGAKRFVDGVTDETLTSGVFYASKDNKTAGRVVDQSTIFPDLNNTLFQDNANEAIHRFMN